MAINNIGSGHSNNVVTEGLRQQGVQQQGQQTPQQTAPAGNAGDTVSFTNTANQLRALEQQLASQPVVDVERVNQIRNDIQAGTFSINPDKVAQKMTGFESMMNHKLYE